MEKLRQGSFTVEAAMIMGIVLLVIMSVLQGGLFIYNRAIQTAHEYEQKLLEREEDPSPITFARQAQWIKKGLDGE